MIDDQKPSGEPNVKGGEHSHDQYLHIVQNISVLVLFCFVTFYF